MPRQPRFVEVEDGDENPEELDLPEFGDAVSAPSFSFPSASSILPQSDYPMPSTGGMPPSANAGFTPHMISEQQLEQLKRWSCVYPIYFDVSRSTSEGRKVPLTLAVKNPLAKELAEAAASIGIQCVFEVHSFLSILTLRSQIKPIPMTGQIQVASDSHIKPLKEKTQHPTNQNNKFTLQWQNTS